MTRSRIGAVFAALAVAAAGCGNGGKDKAAAPKAPPPREVGVVTVKPEPVRETGEYLGSLLSRESVNVLPQVSGYVRKIHVHPGQTVEAGAPLVDIDAREEAAALDSAQAQQKSASSRRELAEQTAERTEALFKEGLVSMQDLERARSDLQAAQAAERAAGAAVSQRAVQLQYRTVRAAVPGVVGDVLVRLGDFVSANTQLTSIAQADVLEVTVAIPAQKARTLKPETPLELLDGAGNVLVRTNVFFVAPQADPKTQLVDIKAAFQNRAGFRPSELVRARVVYDSYPALQVPALSVIRQSGQAFVYGVQEKDGKITVERRPVTLGDLGSEGYVVTRGLHEGDRIAVSSLQALRDGAPIIPKPMTASATDPHSTPPAQ